MTEKAQLTTTSTPAEQIIKLHQELEAYAKRTIVTAIEIGRLLIEQKRELPHGQFEQWIDESLPFSPRHARRFMKLYLNRGMLGKTDNMTDLTLAEALRLITEKTEPIAADLPADFQMPKEQRDADDDVIDEAKITARIAGLTAILKKSGHVVPFYRRATMKPLVKNLMVELKRFVNEDELAGEFVEGEIVS